uniref:Uncharacterized protein n=1 Tax=Glossina pallidipes TaxID=7398 RepID=A0A1B0AIT0_GLOPL
MFAALIKPVVAFMHSLRLIFIFILNVTYYGGRSIFSIIKIICELFKEVFTALNIFCEEFYRFVCEIDCSVHSVANYVQSSTSSRAECFTEDLILFLNHISKIFTKTKLHTKLLACDLWTLLSNTILLIAERIWWTLTLIPRLLLNTIADTVDLAVDFIASVWREGISKAEKIVTKMLFASFILMFKNVKPNSRMPNIHKHIEANAVHFHNSFSARRARFTNSLEEEVVVAVVADRWGIGGTALGGAPLPAPLAPTNGAIFANTCLIAFTTIGFCDILCNCSKSISALLNNCRIAGLENITFRPPVSWGFQAFTSMLLLPVASPAALSACSCGSSRSSPISKAAAKHCIATSALSWASALKACESTCFFKYEIKHRTKFCCTSSVIVFFSFYYLFFCKFS